MSVKASFSRWGVGVLVLLLAWGLHGRFGHGQGLEILKNTFRGSLLLVQASEPRATIVLRRGASRLERKAAEELNHYLAEMSGTALPVCEEPCAVEGNKVYVGETQQSVASGLARQAAKLADDGFVTLCRKRQMILRGKDDLGTLFAVYDVLEQLGVRWFNPDPLGEVVPERKTVRVPSGSRVEEPDFRIRWVGEGTWALRNRMNVRVDDTEGIQLDAEAHTWKKYLPPDVYYKAHPEYFAQVRKRRARQEGRHRNQLCTSNPAVTEALVQSIDRYLAENPGLDVVTLFPNDGLGFCECPSCEALDESWGPTVEDINRRWRRGPEWHHVLSRRMALHYRDVATRLAAKHPGLLIRCGLYNAYLYPPRDRSMRMPEQAFGEICHGQCHNHSIADPTCEENRRFREAVQGWGEIFPRLSAYEYYYKVAALELPFPILHAIRLDIPWYRDAGFIGLYTQYGANYWTIGLNYYVAARLLWDADQDVDEILEDYFQTFYGKASKPMEAYHRIFEEAAVRSGLHMVTDPYTFLGYLSEETLAEAGRALQAALQSDVDERQRARIRKQETVLTYARMCLEYHRALQAAAHDPALSGKDEITARLGPQAERIRGFLVSTQGSHCFRDRLSPYQERFLDPVFSVKQIRDQAGR